MATEVTIEQLARGCQEGLKKHVDSGPEDQRVWARGRLIDLNLWSNEMGVFAREQDNRLDYRLKELFPQERDAIKTTMLALQYAIETLRPPEKLGSSREQDTGDLGEKQDQDGANDEDVSYAAPEAVRSRADGDTALHALIEWGILLRRAGRASRMEQADATFRRAHYEDLERYLRINLYRRAEMTAGDQKCACRDPPDQPPSRCMRHHHQRSSTEEVLSTVAKFQFGPERDRLILANLRRRHRFYFSRKRALALREPTTTVEAPAPTKRDRKADAARNIDHPPVERVPKVRFADTVFTTATSQAPVSKFSPSLLHHGNAPLPVVKEETQSRSQAGTLMTEVTAKLAYPNPPLASGLETFICPCCFVPLLAKAMENKTKWSNHINADLAPYTCPFPDCTSSDFILPNKDLWQEHMHHVHREFSHYECLVCSEDTRYQTGLAFRTHLGKAHKDTLLEEHFAMMEEFCIHYKPYLPAICPVCGESSQDKIAAAFLDHMRACIQDFSLLALPWTTSRQINKWEPWDLPGLEAWVDGQGVPDPIDITKNGSLSFATLDSPDLATYSQQVDDPLGELPRDSYFGRASLYGSEASMSLGSSDIRMSELDVARMRRAKMRRAVRTIIIVNRLAGLHTTSAARDTRRKTAKTKMRRAVRIVMIVNHLAGLHTPSVAHDTLRQIVRTTTDADNWIHRNAQDKASVWSAHDLKDGLCNSCILLDLTAGSFIIDSGPAGSIFHGKRELGSRREIEERSNTCSLCRLMLLALLQQTYSDASPLSDDDAVCEVFWTLDGRERTYDSSIVPEQPQPTAQTIGSTQRTEAAMSEFQNTNLNSKDKKCTRRLSISWRMLSARSTTAYILLVGTPTYYADPDPQAKPTSLFCGRRLDSPTLKTIPMIKRWYDICDRHHELCRIERYSDAFEDLRTDPNFAVIDLQRMCCSRLPIGAKYVALSYTWTDGFTANSRNATDLFQDGSLRRTQVWERLPAVVKDAIAVTAGLGFRYLWVDSICMIQDRYESLAMNTLEMNSLFANADLTICGADGDGADNCLRALLNNEDVKRRAEQYIAHYRSGTTALELMLSFTPETYIRRSSWNSRAWTFQERLLSNRGLIFVAGRVYHQCRTTTMSQDVCNDDPRAGWSIEHDGALASTLISLDSNPFSCFKRVLELYTERVLSYDADILHAFQGVSNVVCQAMDAESVWGLPSSYFDLALLWDGKDALVRRESMVSRDAQQRGPVTSHFPTWSWCGWKCSKRSSMQYSQSVVEGLEDNIHGWLMMHTWITFYIIDEGGRLRLVWNPHQHHASSSKLGAQRGYVARLDGLPTEDRTTEPTCDFYGRPWSYFGFHETRGRLLSTTSDPQFTKIVGTNQIQLKVLQPDLAQGKWTHRFPDKSLLQFWTWSARFHLRGESTMYPFSRVPSEFIQPGHGLQRFAIIDKDGDFAGTIVLDQRRFEWQHEAKRHEFIAISNAKGFTSSEYNEWNFITEHDRNSAHWQVYNVLLLVNDEKTKISYRAGLGKIFHRSFDSACREEDGSDSMHWKEIILG